MSHAGYLYTFAFRGIGENHQPVMAKFLNTSGVSYHLEELIKNTKDKLILISPYLQFNQRIKENIAGLTLLKKDIRIIYRENKLAPDENNWLSQQIGVRTSLLQNLHAKCYLNEDEAIITSMNLYEFSQVNNNEMGIYISRNNDPELYKSVVEEAERLLRISEEIRVTVHKLATAPKEPSNTKPSNDQKPLGYCIRTAVKIPFNIEKPFSTDSFKEWDRYKKKDYPEKFCHFSGEPSHGETSFEKPILKKNWKKAREIFGV